MTPEQRFERLESILSALAASIVSHDNQIDALIKISEQNVREWQQLRKEFQAYLNTLPRQ
jgi:hypothetical protein